MFDASIFISIFTLKFWDQTQSAQYKCNLKSYGLYVYAMVSYHLHTLKLSRYLFYLCGRWWRRWSFSPSSALPHRIILEQDTEPHIAHDELVGTLHGSLPETSQTSVTVEQLLIINPGMYEVKKNREHTTGHPHFLIRLCIVLCVTWHAPPKIFYFPFRRHWLQENILRFVQCLYLIFQWSFEISSLSAGRTLWGSPNANRTLHGSGWYIYLQRSQNENQTHFRNILYSLTGVFGMVHLDVELTE